MADDLVDVAGKVGVTAVQVRAKSTGKFKLSARLQSNGRTLPEQGNQVPLFVNGAPAPLLCEVSQESFDARIGSGLAGFRIDHQFLHFGADPPAFGRSGAAGQVVDQILPGGDRQVQVGFQHGRHVESIALPLRKTTTTPHGK